MADLNILQGGIKGKLGASYGYRRKKQNVISATPFSHAPHSATQKASFSAFSKLQKFSGVFCREFFEFSGLPSKNKNPMNVSAHYFKPLIENHQYIPLNLDNLLPQKSDFVLSKVEEESSDAVLALSLSNTRMSFAGATDKLLIVVQKENGDVIDYQWLSAGDIESVLHFAIEKPFGFYVIAVKSVFQEQGYKLHSSVVMNFNLGREVIETTWYVNFVLSPTEAYSIGKKLFIHSDKVRIEGEKLIRIY